VLDPGQEGVVGVAVGKALDPVQQQRQASPTGAGSDPGQHNGDSERQHARRRNVRAVSRTRPRRLVSVCHRFEPPETHPAGQAPGVTVTVTRGQALLT